MAGFAERIWKMGKRASAFSPMARCGCWGAHFKRIRYKLEGSFVKDLSNSLKTFHYFATLLQNDRGGRAAALLFEGLREAFFKKFP